MVDFKALGERVAQKKLGRELASMVVELIGSQTEVTLKEMLATLTETLTPASVERQRKEAIVAGRYVLQFGKYQGKPLTEVEDTAYLLWLLDSTRETYEGLQTFLATRGFS